MLTIQMLRKQLESSTASDLDHRTFSIQALEQVLKPATARRVLYGEDYDPEITTIKKLVDAGLVTVDIPVDAAEYEKLLKDFSNADLRTLARNQDDLKFRTFQGIRDGRTKRIWLSTAVAILSAIQNA